MYLDPRQIIVSFPAPRLLPLGLVAYSPNPRLTHRSLTPPPAHLDIAHGRRVSNFSPQKLLRLKDLRIESLMLLHNHRQGKTGAVDQQPLQQQRDEEAAAANGGGGGGKLAGGGGGAAAGPRSASATPTRRKAKGAAPSSTGGGSRKKCSPRDRRAPRSAGAAARGNLRSSPPRSRAVGRGFADPLGGVGGVGVAGGNSERAAFPAAPPPSPMMPKDMLRHFALEDTDSDSA